MVPEGAQTENGRGHPDVITRGPEWTQGRHLSLCLTFSTSLPTPLPRPSFLPVRSGRGTVRFELVRFRTLEVVFD